MQKIVNDRIYETNKRITCRRAFSQPTLPLSLFLSSSHNTDLQRRHPKANTQTRQDCFSYTYIKNISKIIYARKGERERASTHENE